MATQMLIVILSLVVTTAVATEPQGVEAERLVADYLAQPYPQDERLDEARSQRLDVLRRLGDVPDQAADAVGMALSRISDPRRRAELAEALGQYVQTKDAATLLCKLLDDPDDHVRWEAIHGLRKLAARTDRPGGQRIQREPVTTVSGSGQDRERTIREALTAGLPAARRRRVDPKDERTEPRVEFAPKVEGLVPYLVKAADDDVEANRVCALYALADSRDPSAVVELRNRLTDPNAKVRFYAACFLTEYQDASGLDVMLETLDRLCATNPEDNPEEDFDYYTNAEQLLASFERLTGKSLGQIPMNPTLLGSSTSIEYASERFESLLATWSQWWSWQPPLVHEIY